MKIKVLVLCLAIVVTVVLGISPERAGATPYPAHNTPTQFYHAGCLVMFMHGNFYSAAYAKFRVDSVSPNSCGIHTTVRVTGVNSGGFVVGSCSLGRCSPDAHGWYQATAPFSSLLGSKLTLCPDSGSCRLFDLPGY